MELPVADFKLENEKAIEQKLAPGQGYRVNPVYLPAPDKVARAFYTAFKTPPRLPNEPWLHQSLGHSISTIFWGFFLSSIVGVPLGVLGGTYRFFARLHGAVHRVLPLPPRARVRRALRRHPRHR